MEAAWKRRRLAAARGPLGTLLAKLLRKLRSAGTIGKIVLGYFQVLHAFSQLPSVRWPARFAAFLERLSLFSFQLFSAYPLSCVLDGDVSFVHQLLGTLLLPIIGAALVLLLALLVAQCTLPKGERGMRAVAVRPEACTLQLWLLLLLYSSLAKTALTPFDCVTLGDARLLRANAAVSCDDDEWRILAALGATGTIIYALGFPLLCFLATRAARRAALQAALSAAAAAAAAATAEASSASSVAAAATATTGGSWAGRRRDRHRRRPLLSRAAGGLLVLEVARGAAHVDGAGARAEHAAAGLPRPAGLHRRQHQCGCWIERAHAAAADGSARHGGGAGVSRRAVGSQLYLLFFGAAPRSCAALLRHDSAAEALADGRLEQADVDQHAAVPSSRAAAARAGGELRPLAARRDARV